MATQIFNFGDVVTTSAVNSSSALKPWNIYEGKFEGLERTELQGKKDPNSKYDTIKFSFSCDEGSFTSSIFVPSKEENFIKNLSENIPLIQTKNKLKGGNALWQTAYQES